MRILTVFFFLTILFFSQYNFITVHGQSSLFTVPLSVSHISNLCTKFDQIKYQSEVHFSLAFNPPHSFESRRSTFDLYFIFYRSGINGEIRSSFCFMSAREIRRFAGSSACDLDAEVFEDLILHHRRRDKHQERSDVELFGDSVLRHFEKDEEDDNRHLDEHQNDLSVLYSVLTYDLNIRVENEFVVIDTPSLSPQASSLIFPTLDDDGDGLFQVYNSLGLDNVNMYFGVAVFSHLSIRISRGMQFEALRLLLFYEVCLTDFIDMKFVLPKLRNLRIFYFSYDEKLMNIFDLIPHRLYMTLNFNVERNQSRLHSTKATILLDIENAHLVFDDLFQRILNSSTTTSNIFTHELKSMPRVLGTTAMEFIDFEKTKSSLDSASLPSLATMNPYHHAVISDSVIAASIVIKSIVVNSSESDGQYEGV